MSQPIKWNQFIYYSKWSIHPSLQISDEPYKRSYAFKVQPLCFWSATAMLLRCNRYAFEVQPLCVWSATAMRLKCKSYAFEVQELCFWGAGAMLLECRSYAFGVQELCFWLFFASKMRQKQRLFTPHLLFWSFKEQRIIYKIGIITDKSEIFID